LLGNQGTS